MLRLGATGIEEEDTRVNEFYIDDQNFADRFKIYLCLVAACFLLAAL
jgi:hypothetical protein